MGLTFTCERDVLAEGISVASRVAMTRSSMPALEGVLVTGREDCVKLTGYNLESGIECFVEARVKQEGEIVLPATTFGDIVRKLPDGAVTVEVDNVKVTVTCGLSQFLIMGYPAVDFPEVRMERLGASFTISQGMLKDMIYRSVFAVSTSDAKPVHTGCKFVIEGDVIEVIGVDGYRLALRREKLEQSASEPMSFVISGKLLVEMSRVFEDSDEPVSIWVDKRRVLMETSNLKMTTRTLEGEFLNYQGAIPTKYAMRVLVENRLMADCLDRAALLISERQRSPVKIHFFESTAVFTCASPLGTVSDEIQIESSGGELEIGFNNKFLQDALRYCGEDKVYLEMSSPISPMVMRPCDNDKFTYLVLPVRMKAGQ